jgi:predicted nucleotide-binding protein
MTKINVTKSELKNMLTNCIKDGELLRSKPVRPAYTPEEGELSSVEKYDIEYKQWNNRTVRILKSIFDANDDIVKEFEQTNYPYASTDAVRTIKESLRLKIDYLSDLIEISPTFQEVSNTEIENAGTPPIVLDMQKIFIVHGHDNALKEAVARILEHLNLNPIILHEQVNQGQTIIEKFESNSAEAGFAIILLTADDLGKAKDDKADRARARQNVVFEMGYFMGKLGRNHVFVLLEDGVEKPGDLDGIVYTPVNSNWQLSLVQELKVCGYNVDANDLLN